MDLTQFKDKIAQARLPKQATMPTVAKPLIGPVVDNKVASNIVPKSTTITPNSTPRQMTGLNVLDEPIQTEQFDSTKYMIDTFGEDYQQLFPGTFDYKTLKTRSDVDVLLQETIKSNEKKQQETQLEQSQQKIDYANKVGAEELKQADTSLKGSIGAVNSLYGGFNLEGVSGGSTQMFAKEYSDTATQKMVQLNEAYNQQKKERQDLIDNAKKAAALGDIKLAETYNKQAMLRDKAMAELKVQAETEATQRQKEAMDYAMKQEQIGMAKTTQAYNIAQSLPASSLTTPEAITSLFSSIGATIDPMQASGWANANAEIVKLEESKRDEDRALAVLKRKQLGKEIQQIGLQKQTAAEQNFNTYQKLKASDPVAAKEFAVSAGIMQPDETPAERSTRMLKEQLLVTQNAQEKAKLIEQINQVQGLNNLTGGTVLNNLALYNSGEVLDLDTTKRDEGQCGAFVNDMLGSRMFGDSYYSKAKYINSQEPQVGSVFISTYGGQGIGHCGFVESVNGDGTVTLADANYDGKGTFNRRNVPIQDLATKEKITGYYNPVVGARDNAGKQLSEGQKLLMSTVDISNIKSTDLASLKQAGLTTNDLFNYRATEKTELPEEKKVIIKDILQGISDLRTGEGKSGAVGFGLQKIGADDGWSGTKTADFISKFNTFKDTLTLPNLDKLKGAMSDKDLQFLRNTSTALSLKMSEEEFDKTLNQLEQKYTEKLESGSVAEKQLNKLTDLTQIKQVNDMLDKLEAEGVTEEEMKASLINKGIDPSVFFN